MKPTILILFFFVPIIFCRAQLKADFTTNDGLTGGCSPFTVSFKNLTTGASSTAIYKWDLGNSNTSSLQNPGATYTLEKTYTVTLTVTDGSNTDSKKLDIIVYKKPIVDFTITNTKGCVPLTTSFTSAATAGDGKITNYFWDFGDGTTYTDSNLTTISHTFTSIKTPRIDLIVTNSYGCQNLLRKSTAIEIQQQPIADFSVTNSVLCNVADTVSIKNKSTGPGMLNYLWNLGNGNTSNATDISHVYLAKGTYDVSLTVTSNFGVGCSNTFNKTAAVTVANFASDILLPATICNNVSASFQSKNSITATTTQWLFSDDNFKKITTGSSANKVFLNAGQAYVKMINTFGTCKDTISRGLIVMQSPSLKDFAITNNVKCSLPATITVNDTSLSAAKWLWTLTGSNVPSATTQGVTALYGQEGTYSVGLMITNSDGCSTTINKNVVIQIPKITITNIATTSSTGLNGCAGFSITFAATPLANIASYVWDFGDSTATSTEAQPNHTFNKVGVNKVKLQYTTVDGCSGVSTFAKDVIVYEKPVASFIISDTLVCGSSVITFTDKSSTSTSWSWFFGDNSSAIGLSGIANKKITHKYYDSGYYSIKLIAYNNTCSDTITKARSVKVMPLFGGISKVTNTCDGLRDSVYLTHNFKFADKINWSYGDGTSETIASTITNIVHSYKQTGTYKIYITGINEACTFKDSTTAFVMLKQSPQLQSDKDLICVNDSINVLINSLENNPYPSKNYALVKWQFNGGSNFTGNSDKAINFAFTNSFTSKLWNLNRGTQSIRAIFKTDNFGCFDTTNYVAITSKGPTAGFTLVNNQSCFKQAILFKDVSKNITSTKVQRQWIFGDGTNELRLDTAMFSHSYSVPASYTVQLKITDTEGCYSVAQNTVPLQVIGPKVNFAYNPIAVLAGSTATYTNTTNAYGSNNTAYLWNFSSNHSTSTSATTINKFYNNKIALDTVTLIAKNTDTQCADTITKIVPIELMELAFSFTTQYINNVNCPPLVAYFKTTLKAVNTVSWNFGDGSFAGNNTNPSHTYYKPGVYKITLYCVGNNNLTDSVFDYITIKGPYATLQTNNVQSCVPATVTLTAIAKNVTTYVWDFGDGTLSDKYDTIAKHQYTIAGIYNPSLIIKDSAGCSSVFNLSSSLVIDTLHASIVMPISAICKAGTITFSNQINSLSDSINPSLTQYHWSFGTGKATDTSNLKSTNFYYPKTGNYPISMTVTTASGCTLTTHDSVEVKPLAITTIVAPKLNCETDSIKLTATSSIQNNVTYNWVFGNGKTSGSFNPSLQHFNPSVTPYTVALISTLNGCSDTSTTTVMVHANPVINITPKTKNICLGDSVLLTANNGISYQWQSDTATVKNTYWVKPTITRNYFVTVKNEFGCINKDMATISVAQPFKLAMAKDAFVCEGGSLQLQALGAASVKWLDGAEDLSSSSIANPIAKPNHSKHYTVVGTDKNGCFTDTASINVSVMPLPTISVGANKIIGTGTSTVLATNGSSNIEKWSWSPSTYLNSANVQSPISTPRTNMSYVVTATTKYGCEAKDTINIKLQCQENNLFIPTAFTPNKDRLNDYFYPLGKGIRSVKQFIIFNRSGEKVFERQNFNINDASSGWNGSFKSYEAPSGVYVYMIEVECDTGDIFSTKGTVTLIR